MLNQKRFTVSGDGSREQFVIGRVDSHGVEWFLTMDNGRVSHCLSVVKRRERSLRVLVYTCDRIGTTYLDLGGGGEIITQSRWQMVGRWKADLIKAEDLRWIRRSPNITSWEKTRKREKIGLQKGPPRNEIRGLTEATILQVDPESGPLYPP
jgi:hypothetical protein